MVMPPLKINKHIEIVSSTRKGLGSMGKESREGAYKVLAQHYSRVGITVINNETDLARLVATKPDLVFLGMKYIPRDLRLGLHLPGRIWIGQYLDEHRIAYTGSGSLAHRLELDKHLAKQRALGAGLKTPKFYVVNRHRLQSVNKVQLGFPLFVKPAGGGGGRGIDKNSVVRNYYELDAKVRSIAEVFGSDSLIEQYLPGQEFSVAILKNETDPSFSLMSVELIAPLILGTRILGGEVKSSNAEQAIKVTDESMKLKIETLAINVFHALGARDYGRIDIRLDKFGVPNFLEANLIPSLVRGYGSFPKACVMNLGLDYESMILSIVRLGLRRSQDVEELVAEPLAGLRPSFEAALESL
jgi:D-alanine-D-alanine ligase